MIIKFIIVILSQVVGGGGVASFISQVNDKY